MDGAVGESVVGQVCLFIRIPAGLIDAEFDEEMLALVTKAIDELVR